MSKMKTKNIQSGLLETLGGICLNLENLDYHVPILMFLFFYVLLNKFQYLFKFIKIIHSFFKLCDNVFGSTEASLQPYQRFKLDGIMIFSDFLTLLRVIKLLLFLRM